MTTHKRRSEGAFSITHQSRDRLAELIPIGAVRRPKSTRRNRPATRILANGSVSELIGKQRSRSGQRMDRGSP